MANAIGYSLHNFKDLGVHTEMLTDSIVDLAEKGVITGKRKEIHTGEISCAFGWGSKKLYDFMDKNEGVRVYPTSYIADTAVVSQYKKFVSINSCLCCDLLGQVGSESLGFSQFSGTGGQLDFVRGARLAESGKSFLCMNSTAALIDGTVVSRITAGLAPGTVVTVPRTDVQYVVTEYGYADLNDKSVSERAEALINIAHPLFREQLRIEGKEKGIIY